MNLNRYIKYTSRILFLSCLLAGSLLAQGQEFYEPTFFNTVFDANENNNSYFIGNNPAYLKFDNRDEKLYGNVTFLNDNGRFKKFLDPKTKRRYMASFSGKKAISEDQIFKGTFGFIRDEYIDWNWLSTKRYDSGSPFLLGDSTTGKTRFNGIFLNAEYAGKLYKNLSLGFSLTYFVDDGFKEVSPRPISAHRDIIFSAGLKYQLNRFNSIGLVLNSFDYNEEIKYQEDEGGVLNETTLIKFRGIDFPVIMKKKKETRYSWHNGYSASLTYQYQEDKLKIAAYALGGLEHLTLKDGKNDLYPEGYWNNQFYNGQLNINYAISSEMKFGLKYRFSSEDMWAKHPNYKVVISENDNSEHSIALGCEYEFLENNSMALEIEGKLGEINVSDFYSDIYFEGKNLTLFPKIAFHSDLCEILSADLGFGYKINKTDDEKVSAKSAGNYYNNFRVKDILYSLTDYKGLSLFGKIGYEFIENNSVSLRVNYENIRAVDSALFDNCVNDNISAFLEFKLNLY